MGEETAQALSFTKSIILSPVVFSQFGQGELSFLSFLFSFFNKVYLSVIDVQQTALI